MRKRVTSRSPTKRGRAGPEHTEGRTAIRGALPTLEWTEQERTNVEAPVFKAHSTHGRVTQGKCATLARAGAVLRKRLLLLLVVRVRRPSSAAPTGPPEPCHCAVCRQRKYLENDEILQNFIKNAKKFDENLLKY